MIFVPARIIACKAKPNYILWVRFADVVEGEVNLSNLVGQGVFKAWESVRIGPESEIVAGGKEIDLDRYNSSRR